MSLRTVFSAPADVSDRAFVSPVVPSSAASPASRLPSEWHRSGNGGGAGPLRSSSSESSSLRRTRSPTEHSLVASAPYGGPRPTTTGAAVERDVSYSSSNEGGGGGLVHTTSPVPCYRHNPYLASPTSETYLVLASPESLVCGDAGRNPDSNSRIIDVTSDRRIVVRARSRRRVSPSARSASEGSHSRIRHFSPGMMNPLGAPTATTDAGAAPRLTRGDSSASLPCDTAYDPVLHSCAASSSYTSPHVSPSPGHLTSLVHAPASLIASAPYTRRRTESPSLSHLSNNDNGYGYHHYNNNSTSRGSPEASSLYHSFDNSAGTGESTSNNPYVGVRITAEIPTSLLGSQEGMSPYSTALQQQQHLTTASSPSTHRGVTNNTRAAGQSDGYGARRTPTTNTANDYPSVRMAHVFPSSSSYHTTPQNSPGAVVLNPSERIMSIASTFVSPSAAPPAAAAGGAAAPTAVTAAKMASPWSTPTALSHRSDTPPPYNQPASAPLSPDTAHMIVPPGYPAALAGGDGTTATTSCRAGLPPYAMSSAAARSEVSSGSHNSGVLPQQHNQFYHYSGAVQHQQQQAHTSSPHATGLPPPPTMPLSAASAGGGNRHHDQHNTRVAPSPSPPPYQGGLRFLHTIEADHNLSPSPADAADHGYHDDRHHQHHTNLVQLDRTPAVLPAMPSHANASVASTPDAADTLSNPGTLAQPHTLGAAAGAAATGNCGRGSFASQDEEAGSGSGGGGAAGAAFVAGADAAGGVRDDAGCHGEAQGGYGAASPAGMTAKGALQTSITSVNGMTSTMAGLPEMNLSESAHVLEHGARADEEGCNTVLGTRSAAKSPSPAVQNEEVSEEDEDEEGAESSAAAGDKMANKKKKKRARRNRKLKFLQDLPPAAEMKFLPPPPPPLPAQYGGDAATQPSAGVDFDHYYSVVLRWYERILADEADFVGFSHPPQAGTGNGIGGATSLDASHATLHNSGVLPSSATPLLCSQATVAGSTSGATPASTPFAFSSFATTGALPPSNAGAAATTRARRNPGGSEVPVLCPRIEQYMPRCDIPTTFFTAQDGGAAHGDTSCKFSPPSTLTHQDEGAAAATATAEMMTMADGTSRLHVRHVDRAVQWAKDLNAWWLCYVHPHSFTSRRQHVSQDFPLPVTYTTPGQQQQAPSSSSQLQQQQQQPSNMGSMYGWAPTSMMIPGYGGGQQAYYAGPSGAQHMGSGHLGMSITSGTGSTVATMAAEHAYAVIPGMGLPPPPPPMQQEQQYLQHSYVYPYQQPQPPQYYHHHHPQQQQQHI